jgi:hypothetical protein
MVMNSQQLAHFLVKTRCPKTSREAIPVMFEGLAILAFWWKEVKMDVWN